MRKLLILLTLVVMMAGCVKSTINLDRVSERVGISPGFVIAAVKGDVTLGDIVESNDTLFFDDLGLMKIVFREDSVINYGVSDFYSSFPAGSYSAFYPLGPTLEVEEDTLLDINPGSGIEIVEMGVITGSVDYTVTTTCTFPSMIRIEFPTIDDGGSPLVDTIFMSPSETRSGTISFNNVVADLSTDTEQAYNRLPFIFRLIPQGVVTDLPGTVNIDISMEEPEFDYIKGYFGQQTEMAEPDTLSTGLDELFSKISGSFEISNPIIRVNYVNSFGLPLRVQADVTGKDADGVETSLNRAPEDLLFPTSMVQRSVESTFVIDRDNSDLPELVSSLPGEIIFGGSGSINPDGKTATPNIIFGDSRFKADVEVEVPMEFWINNLQLTDTVENFFMADENGDSPLDMLSSLELRMYINNGFPLGGSISITMYDSLNSQVLSTLTTGTFFEPAPVDANGRVTSPAENTTTISMTEQFLDDAVVADRMIVTFTLFTTGSGSQDVKIYSDYHIEFKAGLAIRADLDVNLND